MKFLKMICGVKFQSAIFLVENKFSFLQSDWLLVGRKLVR